MSPALQKLKRLRIQHELSDRHSPPVSGRQIRHYGKIGDACFGPLRNPIFCGHFQCANSRKSVKGFGCRPLEGRRRTFGGRRPKASIH
jgi:hypothetical protein